LIELRDITKDYKLRDSVLQILKDVSFTIQKKEFVSIMGSSGSGKSTLLAILGCLSTPSKGLYYLDNEDVSKLMDNQLAVTRNKKIGFVFQDFNLIPRVSALENVSLPLFYAGVSLKKQKELSRKALETVGLLDRINHNPDQLSGGQKQRVAIARALVTNPSIIFADEPTGNLDSRTSDEIMSLFQELNLKGNTIVIVTHDENVARHTKRIMHIEDGQIVRDELVNSPKITRDWKTSISYQKKDTDQDIRLSCVKALPKTASDETLAALKIMLNDKSQEVRIEAIKSLGEIKGDKAFEILKQNSEDKNWAIRASVTESLGKISNQESLGLLIKALHDENSWVRFNAVTSMQGFKNRNIVKDLLHLLEDPDERVRATVIRIFIRLRGFDTTENPTRMLKDESGRVRADAVRAVSGTPYENGEKLIDEYLAVMLKDTDGRVRANTVEAVSLLISKDSDKLTSLLSPLLKDPNNRVRANVCIALWRIRPDMVKPILEEMVRDKNRMQRSSAAYALGTIGEKSLIPLLIKLLEDIDHDVRKNATRSLSGFKEIDIRRSIVELYNHLV
jgi:putative ABC transport system ATP-binding protein